MAVVETGNNLAGAANVDANYNLTVIQPGFAADGTEFGGGVHNGQTNQSENDTGEITGAREARSPETDDDYRLRVAHDNLLDQEAFTDTAQNTGRFSHTFTTLTATSSAAGILTNSGAITTTATGMTFGTFAMFPVGGTQTLVNETAISFSAQPASNVIIDFGMFLRGASTAFAPTDGIYFRVSSAGVQGVINNNGTETTTSVFPLAGGAGTWAYANDEVNKYLLQITNIRVTFWINNFKMGEIETPAGQDNPSLARGLPWSIRHSIVGGAAGATMQSRIKGYRVFLRGGAFADRLSAIGIRNYGSYQGLSGGTMGSLGAYPNSANPTAAAPSNTALTANLPGGLGGAGLVTAAAGAATDGIWGSYQVPAGLATVQGRRLVVRGVMVDALNTGAAVATTATSIEFKLAFNHTAVSLATAYTASFATATTRAPCRIGLGFMTWAVGAGIGAGPQNGRIFLDLSESPIYVDPGCFIALVGKFVLGTATASQTIWFNWQPVYGWE